MIAADAAVTALSDAGFDFYAGVPCSFLTPLMNRIIRDPRSRYVAAASEGEAVAIASGAWLAGRRTVVMFQNSGLGNAVNPLTSLNAPFRIPTLLVVTWRGAPDIVDEPQHALMGRITPSLLDVIEVPHCEFPADASGLVAELRVACAKMDESGLPFALVLRKGIVEPEPLDESPRVDTTTCERIVTPPDAPPLRHEALRALLDVLPERAAVIATTGKCGRELFTLADRPQHLYQVGSMGCASGMGLGVALNTPRPVVVLDGDGAALMKLGTLATVGAYAPENLVHVVLDNGVHDSTGGQPTVSASVDFAEVAAACGYRRVATVSGADALAGCVETAIAARGPTLVHARISPGSMSGLGRPTVTPPEVAARFREFLASPAG